ncbi:MAG TPA: glycosyltransferase family 2 protein [Candidatus Eisenbacteria bacterium]|nr:glycosyltransferase family 2 protein [Candidatus Eisenbacteria bacterium]
MSADRAAASAGPVWAVVLAFNQYDYTRECLRALGALDPAPDHVLLVDSGSSDGTPARARAEFPEVEVLALGENRWFAGGVNAGFERALAGGAGSVLLLNNDLVLERGALGVLRAALEADPARGAVSPKLFYFDPPDRIWFAGGVVTRGFGLIRHRGVNRKDDAFRDRALAVDYVSGAAVLLSRAALERTGLLDTDYVIYVEDVDWSARARKAGFILWYEPGARGWHHVSITSGGGLTPLKAYFRLRSGALYLSRHEPAAARPLAWLAYGAWTISLLVRMALARDVESMGALLLGFADFTRVLLGGRAPARTPESFARRAPRG